MTLSHSMISSLADGGAFLGWFALWWHLRRWPHPFAMSAAIFLLAFWRLWEAFLFYQVAKPTPSWLHHVDMSLRGLTPFLGVYYFYWIKKQYRIIFAQTSQPTVWWDVVWMKLWTE